MMMYYYAYLSAFKIIDSHQLHFYMSADGQTVLGLEVWANMKKVGGLGDNPVF